MEQIKCGKCNSNKVKHEDRTLPSGKVTIKCECLKCGELWLTSYETLSGNRSCPSGGKLKKLNKAEVVKRIKATVAKNIIVDYDFEYINANTKNIKCCCTIDGYEWVSTYNVLMNGNQCRKCSGSLKLTQAEVEAELKKNGNKAIKILPFVYKSTNTKNISCECKKGHHWVTTFGSLRLGAGCVECRHKGAKRV